MTFAQQLEWKKLAQTIREASARAEALGSSYVDNHGKSLGDEAAAAILVAERLESALAEARRLSKP